MAQDGDTITYTFDNNTDGNGRLIPQTEDVSNIDKITVDYLDGAGGRSDSFSGGDGGRVEQTVFDVSDYDTVYIWVAGHPNELFYDTSLGRYNVPGATSFATGGGSTEIAFVNTDASDSADEPFIVGAGGGGGGSISIQVVAPL